MSLDCEKNFEERLASGESFDFSKIPLDFIKGKPLEEADLSEFNIMVEQFLSADCRFCVPPRDLDFNRVNERLLSEARLDEIDFSNVKISLKRWLRAKTFESCVLPSLFDFSEFPDDVLKNRSVLQEWIFQERTCR